MVPPPAICSPELMIQVDQHHLPLMEYFFIMLAFMNNPQAIVGFRQTADQPAFVMAVPELEIRAFFTQTLLKVYLHDKRANIAVKNKKIQHKTTMDSCF